MEKFMHNTNPAQNDNMPAAGCGKSGFNYCLFSKSLVALPALSLVAYVPTTLFSNPVLQIAGAAGAVALTIYAAIWLDRLPLLQRKFRGLCAK